MDYRAAQSMVAFACGLWASSPEGLEGTYYDAWPIETNQYSC